MNKVLFFILILFPIFSFSQLQASGPISFSDIQTELGITPATSNQDLAGGSVPAGSSLFNTATGTINKSVPHSTSEFYGYNQVDDFVMSTVSYASAGLACDDTDIGATKWHDGAGVYPVVSDIIYNEGTSTTVFNGAGLWYRIVAEDQVIRINSSGVVLEKEDCAQTFSFTLEQLVVDEDAITLDIDVTSNTSWTLSENQTWASIASPTGSGNATKVLSIDAHTGTGTRTVTVTGVYGLGNQQTNVDQLDIQYQDINGATGIGYSAVSSTAACGASTVKHKGDTGSLSTTTIILNWATELPAPAGWYSDGTVWKYWDGTIITTGDLCP